MELFVDFIGNGAIIGGTPVFGATLKSAIMRSATINNNNIMNSTALNATTLNNAALNHTASFIDTAVNNATLNNTVVNNSTFIGTTFANTTLNSSYMNNTSSLSFDNSSVNIAVKNSVSFIGAASSDSELTGSATNGQHPVVVASNDAAMFHRMSSTDEVIPLTPPASSEFEATSSPSSMSSFFPTGPSTTGKRKAAEVNGSTPLKLPKKHRGLGEDREIKRCKRSLTFIPTGSAERTEGGDPVDGSEGTAEKSGEKKTTTRPRASVERRNKRERMRVKQINNTFLTLRNQLPSDGWSAKRNAKKFSKVDTLRTAIEYIRGLRQLITDHDAMFMSAECLALLSCAPTEGHDQSSSYHNIPGFIHVNGGDSASDRSGAESVGSSTTDAPPPDGPPSSASSTSSSYPSSSSSSSSFSASAGITDFFPPMGSHLSEDLLVAFLDDMYMHVS